MKCMAGKHVANCQAEPCWQGCVVRQLSREYLAHIAKGMKCHSFQAEVTLHIAFLTDLHLQFVETRCLKTEQSPFSGAASPPSAASSKFAVNAGVVREYLAALTKSGQLGEYGEGVEGPVTPGKSHRSLQLLLQELRQALQQEGVALEPGAAVGRPLHVYVQVGQDR